MSDSTVFRSTLRGLLGDAAGRRWTDADLDLALSFALDRYSQVLPNIRTVIVPVHRVQPPNTAVLQFAPAGERTVQGARMPERNMDWAQPVSFWTGHELYLKFGPGDPTVEAGCSLELLLGTPHTIRGLGEGLRTTIPDGHLLLICEGAAGYALQLRGTSVIEVFGKRPEDAENLIRFGNEKTEAFLAALNELSRGHTGSAPLPRGGWDL